MSSYPHLFLIFMFIPLVIVVPKVSPSGARKTISSVKGLFMVISVGEAPPQILSRHLFLRMQVSLQGWAKGVGKRFTVLSMQHTVYSGIIIYFVL